MINAPFHIRHLHAAHPRWLPYLLHQGIVSEGPSSLGILSSLAKNRKKPKLRRIPLICRESEPFVVEIAESTNEGRSLPDLQQPPRDSQVAKGFGIAQGHVAISSRLVKWKTYQKRKSMRRHRIKVSTHAWLRGKRVMSLLAVRSSTPQPSCHCI